MPYQYDKLQNGEFQTKSTIVPVRLTFNSSLDSDPAVGISANGTNCVIVWDSNRSGWTNLWMKYSADGGESWFEAEQLTFGINSVDFMPDIIFNSKGTAFIVWSHLSPSQTDIKIMNSTDGGQSWSPPQNLTNDEYWDYYPSIAIDSSDNLFVSWSSYMNENSSIWIVNSSNDGMTWSDPEQIAPTNTTNSFVACKSNNYCLVGWFLGWTGSVLQYSVSTDQGQTWSPIRSFIQLYRPYVYRLDAQFDFNNDLLLMYCVEWLHFERSTDSGMTWGATYRLLNESWGLGTGKFSINPGGRAILVWSGTYAGGNEEIWFVKIDPPVDPDGDLLSTFEEVLLFGTDPNSSDSDADGLSDKIEIDTYGTDPLNSDTDGDGFSDGTEVWWGTNPLISLSNPLTRIIIIAIPVSVISIIIIKLWKRKRIS